jgi:hypothetical protein
MMASADDQTHQNERQDAEGSPISSGGGSKLSLSLSHESMEILSEVDDVMRRLNK